MAKRKKPAYYAVRVGRVPGVYRTWDECRAQTNGHSGAVFKGFGSEAEAKSFVAAASGTGGSTTTAKRARRAERSPQTDVSDPSHRSSQPTDTDTVADGDGDTDGVAYSSFARRMMAKMGHTEGEGLGRDGRTGITSPVKASGTGGNSKHGVGYGTEKLSDKQEEALRLIKAGSNVFVTGVAGTGKSLLLRRAIAHLENTYGPDEWVAVGPTGPTAVAIGGQTIHSFAGIGVPKLHDDFNKAWDRKREWRRLRAMVIDEVSMISAEFFDALSDVVGRIRGGGDDDDGHGRRAFGGIQLVVCGDFLQLPPIPPRITDVREMRAALATQRTTTSHKKLFLNRGFAFQSTNWQKAGFSVVQLDQVFRQKNSSFVRVLQEIREGRVSSNAEAFLRSCSRPLPPNEFGVRPTVLHSTNGDVTRENMRELEGLPGDVHEFVAVDGIELEEDAPGWASDNLRNNQFFKSCIAESVLKLKVGAQVMLVKNEQNNPDDRRGRARLVNGSRGKVIGFKVFRNRGGAEESDDSEDEDEGGWESLQADESSLPGVDTYPIVQFLDGRKKLIRAQRFESRLVGLGVCTRTAIPLRLAWAITTHKSQGLTLDHVIADVGGVFTEAQAYVALSRASDENGLELRNFDRSKVRANRLAMSFYSDPNADFPHWDDEQRRPSSEIETETATPQGRPDCLQGMAFVFSGVLNTLAREDAEALVKKHGGVVRGAVSGKTNFLVIGDKMEDGRDTTSGTKYGKAMQIINGGKNKSDLQVIDEEGLLRLLR